MLSFHPRALFVTAMIRPVQLELFFRHVASYWSKIMVYFERARIFLLLRFKRRILFFFHYKLDFLKLKKSWITVWLFFHPLRRD